MDPKRSITFIKEKGQDIDIEEILVRIASKHPIELEEKIHTFDKPLILECACPGWQPRNWGPPRAYPVKKPTGYRKGGVRYPAVPCSLEDQSQALIEAVKAGCAAVHVHPRDPEDCMSSDDPELLAAVYDCVFKEVDAVTLQHTWYRDDDHEVHYVGRVADGLIRVAKGSNKYRDAFPPNYTHYAQEGVRFMEAHNIKPIHMIRSTYGARAMYRALVEPAIITKKPYILVHDMGHPFGWPMDIDRWMPIDLIAGISQTEGRMGKGHVIGVYSGSRNWMPITMTAILAGVDIVRVGIEDAYWMYPHKDEVIQKNIDCVNKIVEFCKLIGREIADVKTARKILGIELVTK
jgi:3-keto-5-aminohexanoate cleavage enzyme